MQESLDVLCSACKHPKSIHTQFGCNGTFRSTRCECLEFTLNIVLWTSDELVDLLIKAVEELQNRKVQVRIDWS